MFDSFGHQFYPTPIRLAMKMVHMIDWSSAGPVLDISAGKGDLLAAAVFRKTSHYWKLFKDETPRRRVFDMPFDEIAADDIEDRLEDCLVKSEWAEQIKKSSNDFWAIEIDENLQAVLRNRGFGVIGSDFLTYSGMCQPSYILANPPFDQGAQFLLRAIDMMVSGQICCILNSQTLLNPYSLERKELIKKLNELGATVQYLDGQFTSAERPTGVQIALVYIDMRRDMEDVFADMLDKANDHISVDDDSQAHSIVHADRIVALVEHYESQRRRGIDLIVDFHKKSKGVPFLSLNIEGYSPPTRNQSEKNYRMECLKHQINGFLRKLRFTHWQDMMNDPAVTKFLTKEKKEEYVAQLNSYSDMDFTEANIRTFVSKISASYPETLSTAIEDVFDEFTVTYAYHSDAKGNTHYYDGWKSNKAAYVAKRIVIPGMSPYNERWKQWDKVDYRHAERMDDYEKVMSYFEGGKTGFKSMSAQINEALKNGQTSKIMTEFFEVTVYQKGTMHLRFLSEDLRRRFNIFVGSRRAYLPPDYAQKPFDSMSAEEKRVVNNFEGQKQYKVDHAVSPFASMGMGIESSMSNTLRIAA